ncbi:hypothetical protein Tco_1221644 [Tanacetum coccineum]
MSTLTPRRKLAILEAAKTVVCHSRIINYTTEIAVHCIRFMIHDRAIANKGKFPGVPSSFDADLDGANANQTALGYHLSAALLVYERNMRTAFQSTVKACYELTVINSTVEFFKSSGRVLLIMSID